ncbi:nucleoside recognition protein [Halobellus captivus]|uniref:nucleoside recognition protein n=1 Tax=Halobellus captivus TaxID=2592614 RepID=UPI0011A2FFA1|nr:nucleoside recognition protein [Halobellus captivus]
MELGAVAGTVWPVLAEVAPRVARISVFIAVGVFLANVTVEFGLVERIATVSTYLTRPANLPDEVGAAIVTTAASTTAGYGMLAEFRESGRLDDTETLVAVTMNTFFGFVQHIFTFYAPVLIPILGLEVGLLYVGARAAIALGITVAGVVAGAVLLSGRSAAAEPDGEAPTTPDGGTEASAGDGSASPTPDAETGDATPKTVRADADESDPPGSVLRTAAEKTWPKLRRIVPRLAIVYALVTLLVRTQDLESATASAEPLTALLGLPGASLPVIAVFAFDTTAGAATIAPMIGSTFTPRTAVATMLLGGIISFAVSTFKRSIPFQYGIWGPAFGSKVIAVNTALKVVFIAAALAVLLVPV